MRSVIKYIAIAACALVATGAAYGDSTAGNLIKRLDTPSPSAVVKSGPSYTGFATRAIDPPPGSALPDAVIPSGTQVQNTVSTQTASSIRAPSGRNITADPSKAARKDVMQEQGIPISQQPVSQSRNASGREYTYEVPRSGGGSEIKSVQQQTLDSSHPGQKHWEAGAVKTDPLTGDVRMNNHGRPKLQNDKSKQNYNE